MLVGANIKLRKLEFRFMLYFFILLFLLFDVTVRRRLRLRLTLRLDFIEPIRMTPSGQIWLYVDYGSNKLN